MADAISGAEVINSVIVKILGLKTCCSLIIYHVRKRATIFVPKGKIIISRVGKPGTVDGQIV